MAIERFTKEQFEQALSELPFSCESLGMKGTEEVYAVVINDYSRVFVQSTINRNGIAADVGDDSIRIWLQVKFSCQFCKGEKEKCAGCFGAGYQWKAFSKKVDDWTNRTPGWNQRMAEKVNVLAERGKKFAMIVPRCKDCGYPLNAYISNSAKNPGRPYGKCHRHGNFTWLDVVDAPVEQPLLNNNSNVNNDNNGKSKVNFLNQNKPVDILQDPQTNSNGSGEHTAPSMPKKVYEPNREQKEAIFAPIDKAVRVLAPAGAGKTFVIEKRIEYLLSQGVRPENIVYTTFSKDMADSGLSRIVASNPELANSLITNQICTIHALCYRILKEEGKNTNVAKDWQIKKEINLLSGNDSKGSRPIWQDNNKRPGWSEIYNWITIVKMSGLEGNEIQKFYHDALGPYHGARMTEMFTRLQVNMSRMNLVTFPDMLYETELLFRKNPSILKKYQDRYQHMIVDEGQDTSGQAMRILVALAEPQNNFFIVGDTDQLLYRFSGATPENNLFDGFENRYPDAVMVKLITNYRSTQTIIETCNRLIRHNYAEKGGVYDQKYLKDVAYRDGADVGSPVSFIEYEIPDEEASAIALEVAKNIQNGEKVPGDTFIAARTRAQLGYLEGPLIRNNVPFINISGGSFWNLKHVRDILAYLFLANDEDDKESFKRVYNIASINMTVPWNNHEQYGEYCNHRWLGPAFLSIVHDSYKYINAAFNNRKFIAGANDLKDFIDEIQSELYANSISAALQFIIDYCYQKWMATEEGIVNSDEAENGKLEDLQTVIDIAKDYETVTAFKKFVDDARAADEAKKDKNWDEYVVISTIHKLKGLERDTVYVVGCSEGHSVAPGTKVEQPAGLLPHTFSMIAPPQKGILPSGGKGRIEDERDIMFVAVSRAKKECHLSGIRTYRNMILRPSRFVVEMELV